VLARRGADVRNSGSGGTGATNVSRRAGKGAGVLTLLLDALKGAASILVARLLLAEPAFSADASWWIAAAAIAVIVGHIFPGDTLIMASQIGDWPFMGMLFRSSGSLTLEKDVPVRAAADLEKAERAIREDNNSVWMFAEGTRGKIPGKMGPFKRGAFRLAARTGVPVIPVVISPLKPETDLRGRRLTPHDVTLEVLDPVYANGPTREDEEELRDEVRARMQQTLDTGSIAWRRFDASTAAERLLSAAEAFVNSLPVTAANTRLS